VEKEYIGLGKKSAQNLAERDNYIFHLIRIDDKNFFEYPSEDESRGDKICIEIDKGKVVSALLR